MFLWPPPPGPAPLGRSGVPLALCSCGSLLYSLPRSAHGVPRPSARFMFLYCSLYVRCSAVPMAHGRAPGAAAPQFLWRRPPGVPPPRGGSPSIKIGWYRVHPLKCNIDARKARQPPTAPALRCRRHGLPSARGAFGTHGAARGPPAPRAGALASAGGGRPAIPGRLYVPVAGLFRQPGPTPPHSRKGRLVPLLRKYIAGTIPLRESQGLRKSSRCSADPMAGRSLTFVPWYGLIC